MSIVYDFNFTNSYQEFTAPQRGRYKLECWGAQGDSAKYEEPQGKGGYSTGIVTLDEGDKLYVYVGQSGADPSLTSIVNAYNGGGKSAYNQGGGATDIRLNKGDWKDLNGLLSRIIVAGGASGAGWLNDGSAGGGLEGQSAINADTTKGGYGGTQTFAGNIAGKFGIGGEGSNSGGGGGWYGGGGNSASQKYGAGGGGSGYVLTQDSYKPSGYIPTSKYYLSDTELIAGNQPMPNPLGGTMLGRVGNGFARITFVGLANKVPIIDGNDMNLGDKNEGFIINYTVSDADNDELTVIEKLNGITIRTLTNPLNNSLQTLRITKEMIEAIPVGKLNTIEISATDGKATTYRRYTFTKINTPPKITVNKTDLGSISTNPTGLSYSVADGENDVCTVTVKLNNTIIKTHTVTLGITNALVISAEEWLKLPNGKSTITITAIDTRQNTDVKTITFTKVVNKIEVLLKNPIQTSIAATKIAVTPKWNADGGTKEVWVCNNAFDSNPTWENATAMVDLNRPFLFTNKTKTHANWGINIKIKLSKNVGYNGEISLTGFGGAYE